MNSLKTKKARPFDMLMYGLVYASAFLSVALVISIIVYVFSKGIGVVNLSFLTGVTSVIDDTVGIAGNIVNTLYIIVLTLLVATPLGIGAAIYLNEYARPGKLVRGIEYATETLAGIPSIIFGLFGRVFFAIQMGLGFSVLTGALTLTLMIFPLITRSTQEALKTVPLSYRSGALGIGAAKWHMIRTILLPSAMPGIITGVILAIGRIVGESAALLFTAGSGYLLPKSLLGKLFESSGTLTIQMYLSMTDGENETAFGIACVLLIVVFFINLITKCITRKYKTDKER